MRDRELFDEMTNAARRATDAAEAAGHRRDSKIAKDSAFAAAEEVYRRERPEDFAPKPAPPIAPRPMAMDDPWQERKDVGG